MGHYHGFTAASVVLRVSVHLVAELRGLDPTMIFCSRSPPGSVVCHEPNPKMGGSFYEAGTNGDSKIEMYSRPKE